MDIQSTLSDDSKVLTLTLMGKFDYTCHETFQSAYEGISPRPEEFIIDALEVASVDSSALGMLLLLRNHAGGDDAKITIRNAQPDVYKLMHTCRFDELFDLHPIS